MTDSSTEERARLAFAARCRAWLSEREKVAFGRVLASPTDRLVDGGTCRAWRYDGDRPGWWSYATLCLAVAAFAVGGTATRNPGTTWPIVATWATAAACAGTFAIGQVVRRRYRRVFAVGWDRGTEPFGADELALILDALRASMPDPTEAWLLTTRPAGSAPTPPSLRLIHIGADRLVMGATPTVERQVAVLDPEGLGARAAARLAAAAAATVASATVSGPSGKSVDARDLAGLLLLGARSGESVVVRATGEGAAELLDALEAALVGDATDAQAPAPAG
jgi:phosphotransferase system HPr (HPr) family protein